VCLGAYGFLKRSIFRSIEFWTRDRRFGLRVDRRGVHRIRALCVRAAKIETGGILIGYYTPAHDCAVVTRITGPPRDSQVGVTWFHRGVAGLQRLLDRLWYTERQYYLGEWHFHPGGSPQPSPTDIEQLQRIAASPEYHCPEPLLLVVGGDPPTEYRIRAFVFQRSERTCDMMGPEIAI
jgi:integrative and conjugative element protein (TIGR02256 family)